MTPPPASELALVYGVNWMHIQRKCLPSHVRLKLVHAQTSSRITFTHKLTVQARVGFSAQFGLLKSPVLRNDNGRL